ncbi:hypothetical protein GGR53DRAFT_248717 [Hypoxylon sp. FL1150]|nr:hypothetical protein GGR53DRAFT_248717 [Hypoxylon sp. FL1150]
MEDELTLPKLPTVSWDSETQTFSNTRKRGRDGAPTTPAFNNSSDPAVFSSDDDPHLENYTQGRHHKKRYIGTWFQQHPASSDSTFSEAPQPLPKTKRTFRRQLDSGVWMGSDFSVDMEDDTTADTELPAEPRLPQLRHARSVPVISPLEQVARDKIQRALEDGVPTVDLSSFNLESISNKTISQISIFDSVLNPDFPDTPRDTFTKLYLSNNPLLRAPGAIFNLEYLSVLSLRNTQITELPPSIGNLRNLETLNLSLTRLRYLPGELLNLMKYPSKLQTLTIHPNPFYQPDSLNLDDTQNYASEDEETACSKDWVSPSGTVFRHWLTKDDAHLLDQTEGPPKLDIHSASWDIHILARSPVQFSDSRGTIVSKFRLPHLNLSGSDDAEVPSNMVIETEDLGGSITLPHSKRSQGTTTSNQGSVQSLFELALQACSRSGQLHELSSYLSPNAPPHLVELLDEIAKRSEDHDNNSGALPCSICGRRVMVPVTQWIEWCAITRKYRNGAGNQHGVEYIGHRQGEKVPFLRRGCSWKCLPRPMIPWEQLPGTLRSCALTAEEDF